MPNRREPNRPRRGAPLPPVGARTPGLEELGGDEPPPRSDGDGWNDDEWDEPNYLIRRALVVGAGIVAVAVAAFGITQLVGGDDDGSGAGGPAADWNSLVVLTSDEIRVVDPDNGDVLDSFDSTDDLLDAQSVVGGGVLVTMNDAGRITLTDLADGTTTRARSGPDETLRLASANPRLAIAGPDGGGDIVLIDTTRLETLTVSTVADIDDPLVFPVDVRVNPSGTHAAMPEARTFQSIVIDIENETVVPLAGQVIAIGDESVVTAQRRGDQAELEFYDLAGTRLGTVDAPTPVASMLTPAGDLLMVDDVGAIRSATPSGDLDEIGTLSDPDAPDDTVEIVSGTTTSSSTRLLAASANRVFVVRADGTQIGVATGVITSPANSQARCVAVGSPRSSGSSVLLDVDDASTITEIAGGIVAAQSADGCTVALIGSGGPQVVADGEIVAVDADSIVDIAPDGAAYVVLDGRDTELLSIDDDSQVEIADETSVIRFAQR